MKRICLFLLVLALGGNTLTHGQDPAVEERLNKLNGHIEDLLAAKVEQDRRIAALTREVNALREQLGRPNANYASTEDVRRLAETVRVIDQNRVADTDRIVKLIENLGKTAAVSSRPEPRPSGNRPGASGGAAKAGGTTESETGFEYVIASGDTLSAIAEAYRQRGVRVTPDQILRANPGLQERSLRVGQKIFIPGGP